MTREEIMRLEGRELDAAVHQHVFGRRVRRATKMVSINGGEWLPLRRVPADPDTGSEVPHYSADIGDAWQVIERMWDLGWYVDMGHYEDEWEVAFYNGLQRYEDCGWPPAAVICRAALLAVAGEAGEDDAG